jgi:non-ribosomal peptide synthetase component F
MPDPTAAHTIDQLVRLRAAQDGDKPMVTDPAARISYRELDTTTRDLAAAFIEAGVGKGTRVGLIMPNNTRWVQIAVALTRIGAVLVPLSTLLAAGELVAQLRAASVQFLVSVEEFSSPYRRSNFLPYGRFGRPIGSPMRLRVDGPAGSSMRCAKRSPKLIRWSSYSPRVAADRPRGSCIPMEALWARWGRG